MSSIHKVSEGIKRKMAYIPFDFFIAILICLVGFGSFALGWIAHSQHVPHMVEIEHIPVLQAQSGGIFVGSLNSDKFHYRWCAGAAQIAASNRIYFTDKQSALQSGYKPAGNCPGL